MQGYVLAFHPATRAGTIVTDTGDAISFALPLSAEELQGGDVVRFELEPAPPERPLIGPRVVDLEVVQRGIEQFSILQNPLVKELYRTVQMDRISH